MARVPLGVPFRLPSAARRLLLVWEGLRLLWEAAVGSPFD
jgi:hypothetical protein